MKLTYPPIPSISNLVIVSVFRLRIWSKVIQLHAGNIFFTSNFDWNNFPVSIMQQRLKITSPRFLLMNVIINRQARRRGGWQKAWEVALDTCWSRERTYVFWITIIASESLTIVSVLRGVTHKSTWSNSLFLATWVFVFSFSLETS